MANYDNIEGLPEVDGEVVFGNPCVADGDIELPILGGGVKPNDGVLTIKRNGVIIGKFSANSKDNISVDVLVPKKVSELDNDSGYQTDAIESVTLASGTNNGTLKLTVDGTPTDNIAVKGLNNAAYKDVDTSITASTTSSKLPTSAAVEARINAHSGIDKTGTITEIKVNSTSIATSGSANITVPTKVSDLDNDSGFSGDLEWGSF